MLLLSFSALWGVARATTVVPNWLLAVLVLSALVVLAMIGLGLWAIFVPGGPGSSQWSYTEDLVLGIRWRWKYGRDGSIYHLVSFCPNCDYQIYPRSVSAYRGVDHFEYRCEDCGAIVADFTIPVEEIESRVTRHIQKNLRTGSWSEIVNAQQRVAADAPQAARR